MTNSCFNAQNPPTARQRALVDIEDILDDVRDNINGTATLLDAFSVSPSCGGNDRHAIYLLAVSLYEVADRVKVALSMVRTLPAEVPATGAERPLEGTSRDDGIHAKVVTDCAHVDALTAKAALERLTSLVVQGEIDTRVEADVDAFVCFADGIGKRLDSVAAALDGILRTAGGSD